MYSRKELVQEATRKALLVRQLSGIPLTDALCVYDVAEKNGVNEVRFVDIPSLEEMYWQDCSSIFVSALRPLGRRAFNCAHGFGHHVFGHGNCITTVNTNGSQPHFNEQEFLADVFAGLLLMPRTTVSHGFAVRSWAIQQCTSVQAYAVAGWLGVGYRTLISHMRDTLRSLTPAQAELLSKKEPKEIREQILGEATNKNVFVVDQHWTGRPVDLEVGDILTLPKESDISGNELELINIRDDSKIIRAVAPGSASRIEIASHDWSAFVRVSRPRYCGRNSFRHLDDPDYAN